MIKREVFLLGGRREDRKRSREGGKGRKNQKTGTAVPQTPLLSASVGSAGGVACPEPRRVCVAPVAGGARFPSGSDGVPWRRRPRPRLDGRRRRQRSPRGNTMATAVAVRCRICGVQGLHGGEMVRGNGAAGRSRYGQGNRTAGKKTRRRGQKGQADPSDQPQVTQGEMAPVV